MNQTVRDALDGKKDPAIALRQLRRTALRQHDEMLAAACLLQRLLVEEDARQRWRLLRFYAKETGSPFAVHLISERLKSSGQLAAADRVWHLVKWKPSHEYLANEDEILANVFDYRLPTTNEMRDYLNSLRECPTADGCGGSRRLVALRSLIRLEQGERHFERERELCEQLVREEPSVSSFQMLGIANERLGHLDDAERAYTHAARLAVVGGDPAVRESLLAKLESLRSGRRRGRSRRSRSSEP